MGNASRILSNGGCRNVAFLTVVISCSCGFQRSLVWMQRWSHVHVRNAASDIAEISWASLLTWFVRYCSRENARRLGFDRKGIGNLVPYRVCSSVHCGLN